MVDTLSENKSIDGKVLEYIHRHKTGALFKAAVRSGAIISNASHEQLEALTVYASQMGLAFQIKDDLLDIEGDETIIGKPVGSDIKNQKSTYPSVYGLEKAREMAFSAAAEANEALKILVQKGNF
ncbi:hypothetical protein N752_13710 [Desulforamulus aquiferis]|nr:hypothetical protein N752_13710 [Desulforamulus aquiferis]